MTTTSLSTYLILKILSAPDQIMGQGSHFLAPNKGSFSFFPDTGRLSALAAIYDILYTDFKFSPFPKDKMFDFHFIPFNCSPPCRKLSICM